MVGGRKVVETEVKALYLTAVLRLDSPLCNTEKSRSSLEKVIFQEILGYGLGWEAAAGHSQLSDLLVSGLGSGWYPHSQ